jgi:polyhydroxyalkanoate synthase subunit PhaC
MSNQVPQDEAKAATGAKKRKRRPEAAGTDPPKAAAAPPPAGPSASGDATAQPIVSAPSSPPPAAQAPMDEAPSAAAQIGAVDIERFSRNIARLVEEGGKALAAYLKPREEGKIASETAEDVADVARTLGHVAEYWLSDPKRAMEVQTNLGKAYLDLWASAMRRMAGESAEPVATPEPRDRRFADPEWSSNQFYDFLKQAYLLSTQWADRLVKDAQGLDAHTRQ